jgi:hypothetical protein
MRVSHDEGISWSDPPIISGLDMETGNGMLGVQEVVPGSGNLMGVFESVEEKGDGIVFVDRFEVWSVMSRNDGDTWDERRRIYESQIWMPHLEDISVSIAINPFPDLKVPRKCIKLSTL